MIGVKLKRYHLNKSIHKPYQYYYDSNAIELVRDYYKWAIDIFGFTFENSSAGAAFKEF